MTMNNLIDVYFHMRNHYKKLKNVRSVIDTSRPKARPKVKEIEKAKRISSTSSANARTKNIPERSRSSTRPPTRRSIKDTPRDRAQSAIKSITKLSEKATSEQGGGVLNNEQHEYLQFSLRITEDIIKNDLYTNAQMKQVLNSHFQANLKSLDKNRMIAAMINLCDELSIPPEEVMSNVGIYCKGAVKSKEETCICEKTPPVATVECGICSKPRTPPISCLQHSDPVPPPVHSTGLPNTLKEAGDKKIVTETPIKYSVGKKVVPEVHKTYSESHSSFNSGRKRPTKIRETKPAAIKSDNEVHIIHKARVISVDDSEKSCSLDTTYPTEAKVKGACACEAPSCNPSTCEEVFVDKLPVISGEDFEFNDEIDEFLPIEDENEEIIGAMNEDDDDDEPEVTPKEKADGCYCEQKDSMADKFQMYLEYFNTKMIHAQNIKELNASHYQSSIEPFKSLTAELSVQTSDIYIPKSPKVLKQSSCVQTSTDTLHNICMECKKYAQTQYSPQNTHRDCHQCEHAHKPVSNNVFSANAQHQITEESDPNYIILKGPVYIPKDYIMKSNEILYHDEANSREVHTNCHMYKAKSDSYTCDSSMACVSATQSLSRENVFLKTRLPKKCANYVSEYCKPNMKDQWVHQETSCCADYDLTPQKDTKYDNGKKCNGSCPFTPDKSNNLLLSNRYNRYTAVTEHLSHFYPTIATQVSSMELLKNRIPAGAVPLDKTKLNISKPKVEKMVSVIADTKKELDNVSLASSKVVAKPKIASEPFSKEEEILSKLDSMPAADSTESMQMRISMLKQDLERFKEGEDETLRAPSAVANKRSLEDFQSRDRGVSISEEVELIRNKEQEAESRPSSQQEDPTPRALKRNSLLKYK